MKNTPYEQRTRRLFLRFNAAAKHWGYIEDQGTGTEVDEAKAAYDDTRKDLLAHIEFLHAYKRRAEKLEEGLARLQAKLAARGIEV